MVYTDIIFLSASGRSLPDRKRCIMLKKTISVLLAALMLASVLCLSASAKTYSAAVGEIEIPFEISDAWYVSTLGSIDPGFQKGNDLTRRYFNRFMYSFGYVLWLKNKSVDNEVILVMNDAESGAADYSAMTDAQLNGIVSAQKAQIPEGFDANIKVTKFKSGSVVFLRSESEISGLVSGVYYSTVCGGKFYEIRLNAVNDPIADESIAQQDRLVNDLAAALTFPQSYPSAPETTLPEGVDEEEEVFDLAETTALPSVSASVPQSSNAAVPDAPDASTAAFTSENAETTAAGESAAPVSAPSASAPAEEGFTMEEYVPTPTQTRKGPSPVLYICIAAALLIAAAIAVVIIIKKRKG